MEDTVIRTVLLERLGQALKMLSEEESAIIRELFYEEISEKDLAKQMGLARTTLQSRKYKILEKLKKML